MVICKGINLALDICLTKLQNLSLSLFLMQSSSYSEFKYAIIFHYCNFYKKLKKWPNHCHLLESPWKLFQVWILCSDSQFLHRCSYRNQKSLMNDCSCINGQDLIAVYEIKAILKVLNSTLEVWVTVYWFYRRYQGHSTYFNYRVITEDNSISIKWAKRITSTI